SSADQRLDGSAGIAEGLVNANGSRQLPVNGFGRSALGCRFLGIVTPCGPGGADGSDQFFLDPQLSKECIQQTRCDLSLLSTQPESIRLPRSIASSAQRCQ